MRGLPPGTYDGRIASVREGRGGILRLAIDIPLGPVYRIELTFGPVPGQPFKQARIENEDFDEREAATWRSRKVQLFEKREKGACARCGEQTAAWLCKVGRHIHMACCTPSWYRHLSREADLDWTDDEDVAGRRR